MNNNILYILIAAIPVALYLLYKLPFWEATRDHNAIEANGSANTLKEAFHAKRATRRFALVAAVASAAATPLLTLGSKPWALAAGGLGVAGLGWLFFTFNSQLSRLRGLDRWYLSAAPHAALFPDRLLQKLGWGLKPVAVALLSLCLLASLLLAAGALYYSI